MDNDVILTAIKQLQTSTEAGFADVRRDIKEIEKGSIENGKDIAINKTNIAHNNDDINKNFTQHTEFYDRIVSVEKTNEKQATELKMLIAGVGVFFTVIQIAIKVYFK